MMYPTIFPSCGPCNLCDELAYVTVQRGDGLIWNLCPDHAKASGMHIGRDGPYFPEPDSK